MAYQGESKLSSLCVVCIKILFRNVAFNYNSKIFDSISSSKWADYDIVSAWFVLDPLVQIHLSLNSVVYEKVNYKWIQLVNMSQSQSVINFNWIFSSLARRSSSFSTVIPLFGLSLCRPTNVKSFLFQLLWVWNGGKGNVEEARNNWGFNSQLATSSENNKKNYPAKKGHKSPRFSHFYKHQENYSLTVINKISTMFYCPLQVILLLFSMSLQHFAPGFFKNPHPSLTRDLKSCLQWIFELRRD